MGTEIMLYCHAMSTGGKRASNDPDINYVCVGSKFNNYQEMSSHYWPTEDKIQTYGKVTVKKLSHEKRGDVVVRRFEVDEKKQKSSSFVDLKTAFTVTQFQYLVWMENENPPIASPLIEMVDSVNKIQMGSGNRPMVVMCK